MTILNPAALAVAALHGMRLDRGHDLVALTELAARGVVGARDHGVRVRGVRAAARLEDERVHARDAAQDQIEPVDELEHALQRLVVLVGVQLGDLGPRRELGREPRVVLHRARPEQADAHHPERLLREVQVVAQHLRLGQLGQRRADVRRIPSGTSASASPTSARDVGLGLVEDDAAAAGRAHLHHERLVPDGGVVAAERHATTSATASASRSRSACVCTSVTQ